MPDLKIELSKALVFITVGAFLGVHFHNEPPANPQQPALKQEAVCKATLTKHVNADGSSDEITSFLAENSQAQTPPATPKLQKLGIGVSLFTDKALQVRYELTNNLSLIGRLQEANKIDSRKDIGIEFNF